MKLNRIQEFYLYKENRVFSSQLYNLIGQPFDSSALNIINAILSAGGSVNSSQSNAINAFVIAGKTDGWWSKMIGLYGLLGGTANSHAINWKTIGTYNVTWSGTISYDSLGVKSSNYTGKGKLTGLTYGPGCILEYGNIHLSAFIESGVVGGPDGEVWWISSIGDIGNSEWANAAAFIGYSNSLTGYANVNVSTTSWGSYGHFAYSSGAIRSRSFYIGQRAANVQSLILNGSTVKTDTLTTYNYASLIGNPFYLMSGGEARSQFMGSNDQHGFFSLGYSLSTSEITSFNISVHNLMTAFGR